MSPKVEQRVAESATPTKTKLDQFAAKHGAVIVSGYDDIGNVFGPGGANIHVGVVEYRVANTGEHERGVTFVLHQVNPEREAFANADYDELPSLLQGIDYISKVQSSVTALPRMQAAYITRGGFTFATFTSQNNNRMAAVATSEALGAKVFLEPSQLTECRDLIAKAKARLDALGKVTDPPNFAPYSR